MFSKEAHLPYGDYAAAEQLAQAAVSEGVSVDVLIADAFGYETDAMRIALAVQLMAVDSIPLVTRVELARQEADRD